ncbi:MAG: dephospho-CoA kinase [Phycisphaerales bacterium]
MPGGSLPTLGICGGIGSGKSTVAAILSELGCVVSDSDAVAREALRDPVIRDSIVSWWGPGVLDESGEIDRGVIAGIVFSSPEQRRRLESLVHPWIETRRRALFEQAPPDATALVIDAPLLFETGLDRECDAVLFVDTNRDQRLARLTGSRGWNEAELTKREKSQLSLDDKRARADYFVINNGDLDQLKEQVRRILNELTQPHRS